jgi:hypothetical protein
MNEQGWITADVKTCPHQYVFPSMCPDCKGWISLKDRSPDIDGRYIVHEEGYGGWVGVCSLRNGKWDSHSVTHWMHLPEKPIDAKK